ncbi:MAG: ATP-binding protein [Chloroflexota bacterium]
MSPNDAINIRDDSGYSFSVATYLAYLRIPASASAQVISLDNDVLNITNERQVPVDDFGFWQLNFFGQPSTAEQSTFPVISLVDVIDGTVDLSIFEDKVVLVGLMNTTGLLDQYLAPSSTNGALMAGVEIQAHAVETIIRNSFPSGGTPALHISILMITSLLSSLILALPRWYWKALLFVGLLFVGFVIASTVFSSSETMLSLFDIALAIALSFLVALGIDITSEQRERQRIEALLTSVQNIAEQQLNLDQAATYILTDIRQLFPIADISLYLQQQNEANITYSFRQKTASSKLTSQVLSGMIDLSYLKAQESFPIRWQQKVQGYITVEQDQALAHNSSQYLTALLEQLAPHIANLLLYSAVENQRSLLDAVVNETPTILVVIQTDGTIIEHNDDLLKIIDSSNTDDFKGRDLVQLLGQVVQGDQFEQHIQDYFAQHQLFQLQELKIGDDVYNLSAAPLPSGERWVIVLNDVTSIAELSALKTQMLRIAAHDLKNPLSRIMGFGELLELQLEETLDERQARYLSYILSGSQEMLDIITDILNLERLRSSKLSLESVNLVKLVDEVCSSYQPDYIQKQQTFRSYLPEMPVHVNADLGQLSQAISNLIGNAIKYTPNEGRINVRVSADAMMVRFEVEDTGYGIPADAQAQLFTEFYRAKTEQTADISGTGLGLSLVKSVITAHNGEVGFKSEEGVGSTFFFTLARLESDDAS